MQTPFKKVHALDYMGVIQQLENFKSIARELPALLAILDYFEIILVPRKQWIEHFRSKSPDQSGESILYELRHATKYSR